MTAEQLHEPRATRASRLAPIARTRIVAAAEVAAAFVRGDRLSPAFDANRNAIADALAVLIDALDEREPDCDLEDGGDGELLEHPSKRRERPRPSRIKAPTLLIMFEAHSAEAGRLIDARWGGRSIACLSAMYDVTDCWRYGELIEISLAPSD